MTTDCPVCGNDVALRRHGQDTLIATHLHEGVECPASRTFVACDECAGEGTVVEQFESTPGGGMPGDDQMGVSVRRRVPCPLCKRRRPVSVAAVFAQLSEPEARLVYRALAQWADNERNHVNECDAAELAPDELAIVGTVEAVVERLETEFVRLAE